MIIRIDERLAATLPNPATKAELADGSASRRTELANGLTGVRSELAGGLWG